MSIDEKAYKETRGVAIEHEIPANVLRSLLQTYEAAKAEGQPHPRGIGGEPLPFWKNAGQPDDSAKAYDVWWERFYAEHCETPTSLESWQAGVAWANKRESVDPRIAHSLTYLHNMLDRRLSHESEAEAAWCDDLLEHVKALQAIYGIEGDLK